MTKRVTRRKLPRRLKKRRTHDLRPMYGQMPHDRNMAAITIEEPGGLLSSDFATLEPNAHPKGAPEWMPPQRPTVIVAQSIRNDPLGQMFARHQITPVRYMAGRGYQELHVLAFTGRLASADPSRPYIQGSGFADLLTDQQRNAARRLRMIDSAVLEYIGNVGLYITRSVLIEMQPLGLIGQNMRIEKKTRGFLFNASLTMMAVKLGMGTVGLADDFEKSQA